MNPLELIARDKNVNAEFREAVKPKILSAELIAEISSRYEAFDFPDPPCTCTRKDVDFYDVSGCESCDLKSDYNRAVKHASYMLGLHAAQDIAALVVSHEELRKRAETCAADAVTPGSCNSLECRVRGAHTAECLAKVRCADRGKIALPDDVVCADCKVASRVDECMDGFTVEQAREAYDFLRDNYRPCLPAAEAFNDLFERFRAALEPEKERR